MTRTMPLGIAAIRSPRSFARISEWSELKSRERSTSTTGLWRLTKTSAPRGEEVDGGRGAGRVGDRHLVAVVDRHAEQRRRAGTGRAVGLHDGLHACGGLVQLADLRPGPGGHGPRGGGSADGLYAGLRLLMALHREDVDLATGVIQVERGWDECEGEEPPTLHECRHGYAALMIGPASISRRCRPREHRDHARPVRAPAARRRGRGSRATRRIPRPPGRRERDRQRGCRATKRTERHFSGPLTLKSVLATLRVWLYT